MATDERSIKNQNKDYRHPHIRQEQDNQPHVSSIGEGVGVGGGARFAVKDNEREINLIGVDLNQLRVICGGAT